MQQFRNGSLSDMGLEQVAQRVPGLILEIGDPLMDFTQNFETGSQGLLGYVHIGDDCIEQLDATFDIGSMRRGPADGDGPSYQEVQIVVGEDFGIELADIRGKLEGAKHVGDFWRRIGSTPLTVGLAPQAAEGIATGLEAAIEGSEDEGDHARLAGINVAPIVGEGGDDIESSIEIAIVLAQTSGVEKESALDARQVGKRCAALEKLVPRLCDIVWLLGKEQVARDRPQGQYVLHRIRLENVAYLVHGHDALGEWAIALQLVYQVVQLGRAARHRLARPLACDLADALKGTVG